jgi:hypothetical protein
MRVCLLLCCVALAVSQAPTGLQLNYMTAPVGIDKLRCHFSWVLPQIRTKAGQQQAQVVVSGSDGTTVYDSGKVSTTQPQFTTPNSLALQSDAEYRWTVSVWSAKSASPQVSTPATFTTGLLQPTDWNPAVWIRGAQDGPTQLRKDFQVPSKAHITRATLFIAACQYYTLYLDGTVVGDQMLDGPWTSFYTNRSYTTHVIDTSLLAPGTHTLGVRIGQGFCNNAGHNAYDPKAERSTIALLQLHDTAFWVHKVASDRSWLSSDSPIRSDSPYYGETYDAREEQPGWATPVFSPPAGKIWSHVSTNFTPVVAQLNSQGMPPIKPVKELPALSIHKVAVKPAPTIGPCALGGESADLTVTCSGSKIKSVDVVTFGVPFGDCATNLRPGTCSSTSNLTNWVASNCVGSMSCTLSCIGGVPPRYPHGRCLLTADDGKQKTFVEGEPCSGIKKKLGISVTCAAPPPPTPKPAATYTYVYDFGQEIAGVVRLTLPPNTSAGVTITLSHAEVLSHEPLAPRDGSVYMGNLFWANPVDKYTTKGSTDVEVYTPSFTYHGFRYVEVSIAGGSLPAELTIRSLVGINLRSAVRESGRLTFGAVEEPSVETSSTNLLQKLSSNSWWTEAAALMSIPAGCAGRGERNGWTGDAAFGSESEMWDFDTGAFFSNYLAQLVDAQGPHGELGGGVPNQGTAPVPMHAPKAMPFDPSWSAVFPVVAYNLWKAYNCTRCIDDAWTGLELYYQMLANNYTISSSTFGRWGDWNPAYPVPRHPDAANGSYTSGNGGVPFTRTVSSITAAAMVVQNIDQAAEMARGTGRLAAAAKYNAMLPQLRQRYHDAFFDPVGSIYGDGTPTAFACALWLGVTPAALVPQVVANFVAQLESVGYRMNGIGFIGVRYIFEALAMVNRTDVALKMLKVTDYPSFGYQITNTMEPATSLWESYDAPTMKQWVDESSRNHHYSASINTFLRKYLAGLDQPQGYSAWEVVKCRPEAALWGALLPSASASLQSHRGLVACTWAAAARPRPKPSVPPAPPIESIPTPAVFCAQSPQFTGALRGPAPMVFQCPAGEMISSIVYARWGASDGWDTAWYCFGPQPPPESNCNADVKAKVAPLCIGKSTCDLGNVANTASLGQPCAKPDPHAPNQLIVRVACTASREAQNHSGRTADRSSRTADTMDNSHAAATWATVNATIPGGSRGEVHVPIANTTAGTIFESGVVVWRDGKFVVPTSAAIGVRPGGADSSFVWFDVSAGVFSFASSI